MSGQCSICLSEYVEPVCIPCGHVYCVGCITDAVNRPQETSTVVKCPTCRADFHLVVPDLTYLPKKYHPFVVRPVRRIFMDESPESVSKRALERDVAKYETRVAAFQATEEKLMQQCERHQAKSRVYREREREARHEKEKIEAQCQALVEKVSQFEAEVEGADHERFWLQTKNRTLELEIAQLREQNKALELKHEEEKEKAKKKAVVAKPPRRRSSPLVSTDMDPSGIAGSVFDDVEDEFLSSASVRCRVVRPLPRRTKKPSNASPVKAPDAKKPRLSSEGGSFCVGNRRETRSMKSRSSCSADDFGESAFHR